MLLKGIYFDMSHIKLGNYYLYTVMIKLYAKVYSQCGVERNKIRKKKRNLLYFYFRGELK